MPKRTDIKKILIIGSGPIIISQACEFDYSGSQACKALREEGFEVVLVNSNPATIMTDPDFAERTYIEPITWEFIEKIIEKERPDALLPTLGGQTGLNVAIQLHNNGVLDKYKVRMIGAQPQVIKKAENRKLFKDAMEKIGLGLPKSGLAYNMEDARRIAGDIGFPVIIRPSFTLGGTGGATAYNAEEFEPLAERGLSLSMIGEVLIEESVIGWKEYELEVMRDRRDNVVIVCSIENFDPMGIHTGDSITVAPAQTLTDREYQDMRHAAIAVIREIGVETGGSNIQFAINPADGRMVVIEMNPRVSRSSALASKATGFPIAKIAAKLAIGYTLDEIPNDITKKTPASFEPTIDYCVVKIPRWAFEKFPGADPTLTIQMKSVGEVMAIGRTFKEALQKGLRGLEIGRSGLGCDGKDKAKAGISPEEIREKLKIPNQERLFYIRYAMQAGFSVDEIHDFTKIDRWFLENIKEIVEAQEKISGYGAPDNLSGERLLEAKQLGFSDKQLAHCLKTEELAVRGLRKRHGVEAVYKLVDTCAAEFEAYTPYYYSTYETPYHGSPVTGRQSPVTENEMRKSSKKKIMILGGGPNRIGQGIEFDYCCVHASFALRELGYESIMVNCNPETVSTDYDTSDKLYFEPLTFEDVMNIADAERPDGVIVQFGGQTPLNISLSLERAGVRIIGTTPDAIDRAEDRKRFSELVEKLNLKQPPNGIAFEVETAVKVANKIGYPVLVRPSYVLGGRAMQIVYDDADVEYYMTHAVSASPERPVLIDKFIEDAIEVDVDMISDGDACVIGGILEHIEEAGVHSGDAAMVLPPHTLGKKVIDEIRETTYALARELKVVGLMNVQYAVRGGDVYILEVNPRASRTIPFVSKAIGVPLAKLAAKVMAGEKLKDLGFMKEIIPPYMSVKESVLPFVKFPGIDIILGPEMKSTGEVMGIDTDFSKAFAKSQVAAGSGLPTKGCVFLSVKDKDKKPLVAVAKKLQGLGFELIGTPGTAEFLSKNNISVKVAQRISEGRPNILDYMKEGKVSLIINTPSGKIPRKDEIKIRSTAVLQGISCVTTMPGALASVHGIEAQLNHKIDVTPIQKWHELLAKKL
ncbi:MAG: carbamoyl-phosphate synthase large subunit [Candidatus Omnitrophica bacterium]|nr:carbamoyl-phosphate synthase large subunit [Candidatus Omnitrophota bacterium]